MNRLLTLIIATATLYGTPAVASPHAHHAPPPPPPQAHGHAYGHQAPAVAGLTLANEFGTQLEIWVDDHFVGAILRDSTRTFSVEPGYRRIIAVTPNGQRVYDERTYISPNRGEALALRPQRGTLALRNDGQVPLFVTVDGRQGTWLSPGQRNEWTLAAGPARVTSQIWTPSGLRTVEQMDVRVHGGELARADVGYTPIDPNGHVRVRNDSGAPMRVYLNGQLAGIVDGGDARRFDVAPGTVWITVMEPRGDILYDRKINLGRGEDLRVDPAAAQGGPVASMHW